MSENVLMVSQLILESLQVIAPQKIVVNVTISNNQVTN